MAVVTWRLWFACLWSPFCRLLSKFSCISIDPTIFHLLSLSPLPSPPLPPGKNFFNCIAYHFFCSFFSSHFSPPPLLLLLLLSFVFLSSFSEPTLRFTAMMVSKRTIVSLVVDCPIVCSALVCCLCSPFFMFRSKLDTPTPPLTPFSSPSTLLNRSEPQDRQRAAQQSQIKAKLAELCVSWLLLHNGFLQKINK